MGKYFKWKTWLFYCGCVAFAFILHKYPGILFYLSLTILNFFDYNNILITIKEDVLPYDTENL